MRIGITTVQIPFVRGGAEFLAESLAQKIKQAGHEVEIIPIPFKWYPPNRILDHMLACRVMNLAPAFDRMIGLKFPAYLIPHPNKVLWLLHQHRQAYDMLETGLSDLTIGQDAKRIREIIVEADRGLIPEARACYTISHNVSDRLQKYCGIDSTPLYHPPPNAERFRCDHYDGGLLLPGRINAAKRQELALQALALTKTDARIVFMGAADDPSYGAQLQRMAEEDTRLQGRVQWTGAVSEEEKYRHYAECRAMIFPVLDEDYGYVTLEAMLASKAVITCTDSGGPLEFVQHEQTGLICPPNPAALAAAIDRLWEDTAQARAYGCAGRQRYADMEIGWDSVLARLLN